MSPSKMSEHGWGFGNEIEWDAGIGSLYVSVYTKQTFECAAYIFYVISFT